MQSSAEIQGLLRDRLVFFFVCVGAGGVGRGSLQNSLHKEKHACVPVRMPCEDDNVSSEEPQHLSSAVTPCPDSAWSTGSDYNVEIVEVA